MSYSYAVEEIHELNIRYLSLVHHTSSLDLHISRRVFSLPVDTCRRIAGLSLEALKEIALTNALIFQGNVSEIIGDTAAAHDDPMSTDFYDLTFHFLGLLYQTARHDVHAAQHLFNLPLTVCQRISNWSISTFNAACKSNVVSFEGRLSDAMLASYMSTRSPAIRAVVTYSQRKAMP